jgi:hypothetical protein
MRDRDGSCVPATAWIAAVDAAVGADLAGFLDSVDWEKMMRGAAALRKTPNYARRSAQQILLALIDGKIADWTGAAPGRAQVAA